MASILSHPRVYSFLHIPVQSGSDKVLSDMRREYSSADFRQLVDFLKEKCESILITPHMPFIDGSLLLTEFLVSTLQQILYVAFQLRLKR